MIGQQKNYRILYHQNYHLIEKPVITFQNSDAYQNYLEIKKKYNCPGMAFFFFLPELQICF